MTKAGQGSTNILPNLAILAVPNEMILPHVSRRFCSDYRLFPVRLRPALNVWCRESRLPCRNID